MFLIKTGHKKQFSITFKLSQNKLDISVISSNDTKRFFKLELNEQCLTSQLGAYFQSMKQIFDYFKQQSSQTINFNPDVLVKDNSSQKKHILTYYILVGAKKKQKTLELRQQTTQTLINTTKIQISQLQKIENAKANIQKKKKTIRQLKEQIKKFTNNNNQKDQKIKKSKKEIQQVKEQIQKKLAQIEEMRNAYKDKNAIKYQNKKGTVLNMAESLQSDSTSSEFKSQASVIYQAMPDSYELCPIGKHVQIHNGKRNLFLKQKQITDSQIQSMIGFDWSEIEVLSFGANKITNKGVNLLSEISDFQNVVELYLFANPITNITTIKFLSQLKKISFYQLSLDQASCDHILNLNFPKLNQLYLDFNYKIREKCWIKIIDSGLKNFPALQDLHVDHPEAISQDTKNKLQILCESKNIQCKFGNPNVGLQNCVIY